MTLSKPFFFTSFIALKIRKKNNKDYILLPTIIEKAMCSSALKKLDTIRNKMFHWPTGYWAAARESLTQHACVRHRQTQHIVKVVGYWGGTHAPRTATRPSGM
jgi:hypothetical protein